MENNTNNKSCMFKVYCYSFHYAHKTLMTALQLMSPSLTPFHKPVAYTRWQYVFILY